MFVLLNRRKKPEKINNKLTLIYIRAFQAWIVYMTIDAIAPLILTLSVNQTFIDSLAFNGSDFLVFTGYYFGLPSLTIVNLLRDIQLVFGFLFVYLSFRASLVIRFGTDEGIRRSKAIYIIIGTMIATVITVVYDSYGIIIYNDGSLITFQAWDTLGPLGYIGYFVFIFTMLFSTVSLFVMLYPGRNSLSNPEKTNLFYFCFGYLFFLIGFIYWIVVPLMVLSFSWPINQWAFQFIGHTFWIISPLAFLRALIIRVPRLSAKK